MRWRAPAARFSALFGARPSFPLPPRDKRGVGGPGPRHVCSPFSAVCGAWPCQLHKPRSLISGMTISGTRMPVKVNGCGHGSVTAAESQWPGLQRVGRACQLTCPASIGELCRRIL
jgi:hypothetical protein